MHPTRQCTRSHPQSRCCSPSHTQLPRVTVRMGEWCTGDTCQHEHRNRRTLPCHRTCKAVPSLRQHHEDILAATFLAATEQTPSPKIQNEAHASWLHTRPAGGNRMGLDWDEKGRGAMGWDGMGWGGAGCGGMADGTGLKCVEILG